MKEYYRRTGKDGELLEARVHISNAELRELLAPHVAPDGFRVESWENGASGIDIWFVRQDPPSAETRSCPDCGVNYVPGARHYSGCRSHPGAPAEQRPLNEEPKHE